MEDKKLSDRLDEDCNEAENLFLEEAEKYEQLAKSGKYTPADTECFKDHARWARNMAERFSDLKELTNYLRAREH